MGKAALAQAALVLLGGAIAVPIRQSNNLMSQSAESSPSNLDKGPHNTHAAETVYKLPTSLQQYMTGQGDGVPHVNMMASDGYGVVFKPYPKQRTRTNMVLAARDVLIEPAETQTIEEQLSPSGESTEQTTEEEVALEEDNAELYPSEPTSGEPEVATPEQVEEPYPSEQETSEDGYNMEQMPEGQAPQEPESGDPQGLFETEIYGKIPIDLSFIPLPANPKAGEEQQPATTPIFNTEKRNVAKDNSGKSPSADAEEIAEAMRNSIKVHGAPIKVSPDEVDDMLHRIQAREMSGTNTYTFGRDGSGFLPSYENLDQKHKLKLLNLYLGTEETNSPQFKRKYKIVYGMYPPYGQLNDETFDDPYFKTYGDHFSQAYHDHKVHD